MNVHRPRRFVAGTVYFALVAGGLSASAVKPAAAQDQGAFGRTTIEGAWADASWVNSVGVIGPLPPSGADVYIGSAAFPSSFARPVAAVTLIGSRTAASLTLGRLPDDLGSLAIQSSGALTTGSLSIGAAGGDGSLTVASGGALTVTSSLFAGSADGMATINLNAQTISVGAYTQGGPVTINRGSNGGIQSPSFSISGGAFAIQSGDSFTVSGAVSGGATVSNSVAVNLSSNLSVSGAGTSYTAAAPIILGAGDLGVFSGATFNANAQVTSAGGAFNVFSVAGSGATFNANAPVNVGNSNIQVSSGGVLNASADVTTGRAVDVFGNGATLNLNAGTLAAGALNVSSGGSANAQDNVTLSSPLAIRSGGAFNVVQSLGDLTGLSLEGNALTIAASSSLNLAFDARRRPGTLDWAFRWQGDHALELQSLLGTRIQTAGAPHPVSVIYNASQFGDFTYIGFIPRVGDLDGDADIDVADYLTLSTNLFTNVSALTTDQSYPLGDLTADLRVDGKDFADFRTAYDEANGAGMFVAMLQFVPEPSTITSALLTMATLALTLGARRRKPGQKNLL